MSRKCKLNTFLFPPVSHPWGEQRQPPKISARVLQRSKHHEDLLGKGEGEDLQKWPCSPSWPRLLLPPAPQNLQGQGEGVSEWEGGVLTLLGTRRCSSLYACANMLQCPDTSCGPTSLHLASLPPTRVTKSDRAREVQSDVPQQGMYTAGKQRLPYTGKPYSIS